MALLTTDKLLSLVFILIDDVAYLKGNDIFSQELITHKKLREDIKTWNFTI